jgi:hypothetical protein
MHEGRLLSDAAAQCLRLVALHRVLNLLGVQRLQRGYWRVGRPRLETSGGF